MLSHAILSHPQTGDPQRERKHKPSQREARRRRAVACREEQTVLGEGVRWDARRGELLRVDILAGRVHRDRVEADGSLVPVRVYRVPGTGGAGGGRPGGRGVAARRRSRFRPPGPDGSTRSLVEVAPAGARMNDGACDPQGRLWAGTMADDQHVGGGALYRLDHLGRAELMLSDLTISNGLGWSPDGRTMYLVDSGPRVVYAFAFDRDPGRSPLSG